VFIRPAHPHERARLYEVCLRTGNSGQDATADYADPHLLGHVYVGPYLALEPDLAFVLDDEGEAQGYVLGARDTTEFERRCEQEWWPPLRERYPDPRADRSWTADERLCHLLHHPVRTAPAVAADYPAHLHIDVLPRAQGSGYGRRLVEHLLSRLSAIGVNGVHLGVAAENERAIGFYRHLGMRPVRREPGALLLGMRLRPKPDG
jgi:ribosomal protein S18 acetylase RimI-like enzyme